MFDIGFLELLICGVIALLVLGPERLPTAARAAGRWIGGARRMVSQFTSELDRQLKADELRKELREAGDVGLEDVQKTVRGALDEAKQYEHMIMSDKPIGKKAADKQAVADQSPQSDPKKDPQENKTDQPDTTQTPSDKPS
ncbi:sec-independent protein translocase protein TatB [Marinobacter sp. LV10R510-11A]|uniref:Sec-independent protein translocase protein TatB n=1 Tax=Marinobacter sp. LV10R510-11A TaxID=1415568 RepID=UPI000BB8406E|nr:Sec-independent protein translocase protein TatB [Marinobacter sp. LV10R510-11A]SOB77810.1 sec-independent protein translocase protein TatB [Marinobacter sp. LV10R510-11A]